MRTFLSFMSGLAIVIAASTTTNAQIDWAAGAPGGTSGGSIRLGADGTVGDVAPSGFSLATGIAAAQVAPTTGADYTISAWINSQQADSDDATLAQNNRWWFGTGDQGLHLGVQQDNSGLTSGHWGNDSTGTTSVDLDTWVHATHVYRAGVQEIYINGVLDSSVAVGAPNNDSTDLMIGARNGLNGPGWDGFLDDVAIFTSALSPEDIATLAADASQAPALGAAAYYNFEDDQTGSTAANLIDVATSGLTGTDGSPALQALDGIGVAPPAPPAAANWTAGAPGGTSGGALEFSGDAVFGRIDLGISATLVGGNRGGAGGSDYTISMWINSSEPNVDGNATDDRWFLGTGSQGLHLGVQNGNTLEQGHWGADSSGATVIAAGTWVHATFTFDADGGTVDPMTGVATGLHSIYLNGDLEGSADAAAPNRSESNLMLGSRNGAAGPAWIGLLDDVSIFTSVLSPEDIATLAADASQAPALGAAAYYNFEDDQTGSTAANLIDVAVSGLTGTDGSPALQVLDGIAPADNALKGDVDLDGAVTFFDIQPFIDVLANSNFQAEADCNCDGVVNFFDIQPFIDILANPNG